MTDKEFDEYIKGNPTITGIVTHMKKWWSNEGTDKELQDLFDLIIKLDNSERWNPCSEKLPQNNIDVLISDNIGHVEIGRYINGLWFDYDINEYGIQDENFDLKVYAWQPLPKAFEVKEQ